MATPELLFASIRPKTMAPKDSIGSKWTRMLESLQLQNLVKQKRVAIKMHLGGGFGYTTIHPFFVRKLVEQVKAAGAKDVFLTDSPGAILQAAERGYTTETVGCRMISISGSNDKHFYTKEITPSHLHLSEVQIGGEIIESEVLIDLSHVKAHGDCGFGGAAKNLSMGCVTQASRRDLHKLEGGLIWNEDLCTHCQACLENCPNHAISFSKENKFEVFYHHCKFCQHCVLICPEKALTMEGGKYTDFQKGLALATGKVLDNFENRTLFINFLMNITLFCDCWGMSGPALVPDIGIIAGPDIVAVEQATLDMIKAENLIPSSLPEGWEIKNEGHLFERLHHKSPFPVVEYLENLGYGSRNYIVKEIE